MIKRLLDRISLCPTRHAIECEALTSTWLDVDGASVELFRRDVVPGPPAADGDRRGWDVIKFVGSGGRAENVSQFPFDAWSNRSGRVWVANPPGYGNSGGRASLESQLATALAVYRHVQQAGPDRTIILMGNSLGGAVALCLAARVACAGLIVRDPPHLRHLIMVRYRFLGRLARAFARSVPPSLNVRRAARRCHGPAVFVSSRKDRIVPPRCQDLIFTAYAGPKQIVRVATDHMEPLAGPEVSEYARAVRWLESQIVEA